MNKLFIISSSFINHATKIILMVLFIILFFMDFSCAESISNNKSNEEVLAPWLPIQLQTDHSNTFNVSLWKRTYIFDQSPFIQQVKIKNNDILSRAINIKGLIEKRSIKWQNEKIKLDLNTPAIVSFSQTALDKDLKFFAKIQIEYDGMIRIDWSIKPVRKIKITNLFLEIPLRSKYSKYIDTFPLKISGNLPANGANYEFLPFIWLGDEEIGFSFFSESDKNWFLANSTDAIKIIKKDDEVLLQIGLITTPTEISNSLEYSFGFQATPVKPITNDVWDYKISHISADTYGIETRLKIPESILDQLAHLGVKTIVFHEHWTDIEGYFHTKYGADLKKLVENCHNRGIQILLYFGFLISDIAPEWNSIGKECIVLPREGYPNYYYPPQPTQNAWTVCLKSRWGSLLSDGIAKVMDEYNIDGVYLDTTLRPFPCKNLLHGCGYEKTDGSINPTYPIFSVREALKRIYKIVKTRKPNGQINIHNSNCMVIPTLEWATSYLTGEQFNGVSGIFATDLLPLDKFRTEFMGYQWGIPAEFLYAWKVSDYRQAYALTLLHGVLIRSLGIDSSLKLESDLWQLADKFGRKESVFLPYWSNSKFVNIDPGDVYVSLYKHPRNGVLVIVSNLSKNQNKIAVKLNLKNLELDRNKISIEDALTNKPLTINSEDIINLSFSSLEWKIIWLKN